MLVPRSALAVRKICDQSPSRYALGAVKLYRNTDGRPVAAATDGRRLVALTWAEDKPEEYAGQHHTGIDPAPVAGFSALIPRAALDEAAKMKAGTAGSDRCKPILANLAIDEHVENEFKPVPIVAVGMEAVQRIDARQLDGKFPRVADVAPTASYDGVRVCLNARLLREILEVIETHAGNDGVVFSFANGPRPHECPVVMTASDPAGNQAMAVLMPFNGPKDKSDNPKRACTINLSEQQKPAQPAPAKASKPRKTKAAAAAAEVATDSIPALPAPVEIDEPQPSWKDKARQISRAAYV